MYADTSLPEVYRTFITSGAYVRYRRASVQGLVGYGETEVGVRLDSPRLLNRTALLESLGLDDDTASLHPIGLVGASDDVLAIDTTQEQAPVVLLLHETGTRQIAFESFEAFVRALRSAEDTGRSRAERRRMFAAMRRDCARAAGQARRALAAGEIDRAERILNAVLSDRFPITYDGRNDFVAIGHLCACFDFRGRARLLRGDLSGARHAFLDAAACGGEAFWEAVVDLAVTSALMGDLSGVESRTRFVELSDFPRPVRDLSRGHFTDDQLDRAVQALRAWPEDDPERPLAQRIAEWFVRI